MDPLNRSIATLVPLLPKPVVRLFSRRYIAGDTLDDAIRVVRSLNSDGMMATLDVLGEHTTQRENAAAARDAYFEVLQAIDEHKIDSNISVKLTQLGLKLDRSLCEQNIEAIVARARDYNNFVRIDMEDRTCTADTLDIFTALRSRHDNVGIVIQAYLRRTLTDVERLIECSANVRVCKGAYIEPRTIAYKSPTIINRNFSLLVEELLSHGCYVGIATHDEEVIWSAYRIAHVRGLEPHRYEFQMLLGVDDELARLIVQAGHRLRIYVPFGPHWFAYSKRRLRENPRIAGYVLQNLFTKRG
jgi:proline dehydrogenase